MSRVLPVNRPGVLASTVFAQEAVMTLRASDFTLSDQIPVGLNYEGCILVLFYVENIESRQLAEIWWLVAQQVAGPTFAACNLMREKEVAAAFTSLNTNNGPLHWAAMKGVPFVLVYQNTLPIAFYNGERAVEPIADYALTLACSAGYREQIQLAGGESIKNNYEMPGYTEYTPERTQSIDYKTGAPIRKFDTSGKLQLQGTVGAEAEATKEEEQEGASGETPTATPETPSTTETTGASETPTSTVTPSSESLLVPTRGSVEREAVGARGSPETSQIEEPVQRTAVGREPESVLGREAEAEEPRLQEERANEDSRLREEERNPESREVETPGEERVQGEPEREVETPEGEERVQREPEREPVEEREVETPEGEREEPIEEREVETPEGERREAVEPTVEEEEGERGPETRVKEEGEKLLGEGERLVPTAGASLA